MINTSLRAFGGALLIHAGLLLFGGWLLIRPATHGPSVTREVDLVAAGSTATDEPETDATAEPEVVAKEMAAQGDQLPDSRQLAKAEGPIIVGGDPALEALTLSQLESVLNPGLAAGVAAGGFAESVRLTSGGRIGGTSGPLAGDDQLDAIFSLSELDQQPRPVVQVAPQYPAQLRKRGVRGTVQVVFIVDQQGRVANPRIEKSTDPAFETPALEAVKKWKFEPGTKAGKRVQFKMRVPITFSAS